MVPGASRATSVMLRLTGSRSITASVRMVADSTEDRSIGDTEVPRTTTASRVDAPAAEKLTGVPVPTETDTPSWTLVVPSGEVRTTR